MRRRSVRMHAELERTERDALAAARHAPELLHDQPRDRVELALGQLGVEVLVELVDAGAAPHAELPLALAADVLVVLDVELVIDVADDLLDDVLDRDQSGDAAVLVDHDRHVVAVDRGTP